MKKGKKTNVATIGRRVRLANGLTGYLFDSALARIEAEMGGHVRAVKFRAGRKRLQAPEMEVN